MLRLMREAERRFAIRILAGVVMSTHFHLVVACTQTELSKAMHWLKATYARDFNKRHQRFGAVFAEHFACRAFRNEQRVANACAYVRANPVKAGLCQTPGAWPWAYGSWGHET